VALPGLLPVVPGVFHKADGDVKSKNTIPDIPEVNESGIIAL